MKTDIVMFVLEALAVIAVCALLVGVPEGRERAACPQAPRVAGR